MPDTYIPTPSAPLTALDWALHYRALGLSVVQVIRPEEDFAELNPEKKGKRPLGEWAVYQREHPTEDTLRHWLSNQPDRPIGIVTGAISGLFIVDVDPDGMEHFEELERRHGELPRTWTQYTPRGGRHIAFRHPGGHIPTRKNVLRGIDIRGDGGFVVAAPSARFGRPYAWCSEGWPGDAPLAMAPAWVLEIARGAIIESPHAAAPITRASVGTGPFDFGVERVTDGREQYMRDTILAVLRDMRDRLGRLPTEAELIGEAWPQYEAKVDFTRPGRGASEFAAKARYTLQRAERGMIRGLLPAEPQGLTGEAVNPETGEAIAPLPLIYASDVQPNLDVSDFVEGLLTERAMSVIYGPSNCGKTFFVSDLALHVATGRPWRGREIEAGGVIYCALEGAHGIKNRVAAWLREHGLEGVEIPFAIIPVSINLLDPNADRAKLVATIKIAAQQMGVPVKWIVIDTLSRAMAGGDENSPEDMGALVAAADAIREECSAAIAFIHHSGKDQARGARGHSLLRAATDTEIEISRPDESGPSTAKVTKQRELEIAGTFTFKLRIVELGTNRRGKPVTSCVVEASDADDAGTKAASKLAADPAMALAILHDLCAAEPLPGIRGIPDVASTAPSVTEDAWRQAFYSRGKPGAEPEAKRKAFSRASSALSAARKVAAANGRVWPI